MANPPPTRRGLLAGAAALSAAGTVAAVPALTTGPDAELIALCRQFHHQHAAMEAIPGGRWDELGDAALEAQANTRDLIEDMPAVTDRGRSAKASVAVVLLVEYGEPGGAPGFALATLRDVAGGAPA